jgi:regulatory protein
MAASRRVSNNTATNQINPPGSVAREQLPDAAKIRAWALYHLGRYAASSRKLAQVLERRLIKRGADRDVARELATPIVADMIAQGYVDDGAVARMRFAAATRRGRAPALAERQLRAEGLNPDALEAEARGAGADAAAALAYMRRRRFGAYGNGAADKQIAAMARAGHAPGLSRALLAAETIDAAEALVATISSQG